MEQELSLSGITGTDGKVPVYEPNSRWCIWNLVEIFMGLAGAGRYVPKISDYVVDTLTDEYFIVTSINPSTMVAVLKHIKRVPIGVIGDDDLLLGVSPGKSNDMFRAYLDTSTMPFTLDVDHRFQVGGTEPVKAKIFKGSMVDGTGKCISGFYDNLGGLLSQEIPLELVTMPNAQNLSVKIVPLCYTTDNLPDGEVVTVVAYAADGHVASMQQLRIKHTAFVRSSNAAVKYVSSISLKSPFLSKSDPSLIQYPLNVPLRGLNLTGVVHYSNGDTIEMPVDGTKFSIFGFEDYIATIEGQEMPLVLKYTLSAGEISYAAGTGDGSFTTKSYKAKTIKNDGAYSIKLFGYPIWIDAVAGYRMTWWLYNLDRNVVYDATAHVKFNANTRMFDPVAYGIVQHLSVSLNIKDVNPAYTSYIHVQAIDVTLVSNGLDRTENWLIGFEPNQDPQFGKGNFVSSFFVNQNYSKIKLDSGALTQADWLQRMYFNTKPLINPDREILPPTPNFFALVINGHSVEFPIALWNSEIILDTALPNSSTLLIKFFKRTADNDIQLSIAGLPVYQSN
jgi:hypothetical protein